MTDDDLRDELSRLDPAHRASDPASRPAPELLERIMATPVLTEPDTAAPRPPRRWLAAAAAAAVLAGAAVAAVSLTGDDDPAPTRQASTLRLALPDGASMSSCIVFDVAFLKEMSPAFAGTVTSVDDTKVVLDVDHWYAGGSADAVELAGPGTNTSAILDGVTFEQGRRYLVTAANGTVNGCGFSGPATPELEQSFERAFGG